LVREILAEPRSLKSPRTNENRSGSAVLGSFRALGEITMTGCYDEPCILVHPAVESVWLRGIICRKLLAVDGLTWEEVERRLERVNLDLVRSLGVEEALETNVRLSVHDAADDGWMNSSDPRPH
jgi:hypothetical protein